MRGVGTHNKSHYERELVELSVCTGHWNLPTELERLSQGWRDRQLDQLSVMSFTKYKKYRNNRSDLMSYRELRHHKRKMDLIIELGTLSHTNWPSWRHEMTWYGIIQTSA